jgi:hypothetical protein
LTQFHHFGGALEQPKMQKNRPAREVGTVAKEIKMKSRTGGSVLVNKNCSTKNWQKRD